MLRLQLCADSCQERNPSRPVSEVSRSFQQLIPQTPQVKGQVLHILPFCLLATCLGANAERVSSRCVAAEQTIMEEIKKSFKPPAVQIAVSKTPIDNPDRSLLKVFPKWLKVAKLWFQRALNVLIVAQIHSSVVAIFAALQAMVNRKLRRFLLPRCCWQLLQLSCSCEYRMPRPLSKQQCQNEMKVRNGSMSVKSSAPRKYLADQPLHHLLFLQRVSPRQYRNLLLS